MVFVAENPNLMVRRGEMKEKRLIICDDDREFISRLGGYISRKRENPLQVSCFTEQASFKEYLSAHEADGVLIGEHWSEKDVLWDGARKMVLTDRVGQSAVEGSIEIFNSLINSYKN